MSGAPLSFRFLRHGEDALWQSVSFRPPAERRAADYRFTHLPEFRPEAHLLAERDGRPVGRMESALLEPEEAMLMDPIAAHGEDAVEVAGALLLEGLAVARRLGVARPGALLDDGLPYLGLLLPRMPGWGFVPFQVKRLFRAGLDDLRDPGPPPAGPRWDWVPVEGPDDPRALGALAEIHGTSPDPELRREDAGGFLRVCAERCRRQDAWFPGDWELLLADGVPAAVVLPSFLEGGRERATILTVGVLPALRGRGLGAVAQHRGLATMARRGAREFLGSCHDGNAPMIRVFERLGYRLRRTQHLFDARP